MRTAIVLVGISITLLGNTGAASAGDCGGVVGFDRVACDCADTVTRSTKLRRSDPVVNNVCDGRGLIIGADRIVLDCSGLTLTGDKDGDGISLADRTRVTVSRCRVTGFTDGIDLDDSSYNTIFNNLIHDNMDDGIDIDGDSDSNVFQLNEIVDNGEDGIDLDTEDDGASVPEGNTFQANVVSGNNTNEAGGDGIEDCNRCSGNKYLVNTVGTTMADASQDGADGDSNGNGIKIEGSDNVIVGNRGSRNGASGLLVIGAGNTLSANRFGNNGQNGVCAVAGNRNGLGNRGRDNIGANVAFNRPSCPVGIVPSGAIASAGLTTSSATADGDD